MSFGTKKNLAWLITSIRSDILNIKTTHLQIFVVIFRSLKIVLPKKRNFNLIFQTLFRFYKLQTEAGKRTKNCFILIFYERHTCEMETKSPNSTTQSRKKSRKTKSRKELLGIFHLNGHTFGFHPRTQKLEPPCTAQ